MTGEQHGCRGGGAPAPPIPHRHPSEGVRVCDVYREGRLTKEKPPPSPPYLGCEIRFGGGEGGKGEARLSAEMPSLVCSNLKRYTPQRELHRSMMPVRVLAHSFRLRKQIHAPRLLKNHDVDRQATPIVRKPCGRWEELESLEASCWWTCGRSWKHPVGGHVACGAPAPSLAPRLKPLA